jgi:hypothetical protein
MIKSKGKIIAVIEICGSSIGGAFIEQNIFGKPKIISITRVPINFLMDVNFEASWRCARAGLKRVINLLLRDYPWGPDVCLCIFHSPWFVSQIKTIATTDKFFIEKIIKQEKESVFQETEVIEHEILKKDISQYDAKVHFYKSIGIKKVKEDIEADILKEFGGISVSFKTFPFVSFYFLKNIANTNDGMIMVSIDGETTDISLIKKDVLKETISFPRGKNFLLRKTASSFNTFPQETSSLLEIYFKGHANYKNTGKISMLLFNAKNEWREYFRKALKSISYLCPLPQNIFFIGDEEIGSRLIKCAEEESFSSFTASKSPFKVNKILFDDLHQYVSFKLVNPVEKGDVFLLIESLFANENL